MEQNIIKDVAIYLRKSRADEGEKDLEKHEMELVEITNKYNWKYITYKEIANSEYIDTRPKFKELLHDITENDLYDAVLVMDFDRLGRGEGGEQDKIRDIFKYSNTFVVTPDRIYNFNNEADEDYAKMKGFFANFEYTQIKRRLRRGKKSGAKKGQWTNGSPPFPYKYDPESKGLVVNEEYREVYTTMKQKFFDGVVFRKIAWFLNNKNIPSPKGSVWHENAIRRTLIDETHIR